MYTLLFEKQVEKQLDKIADPDYTRIKTAICSLALNPRPPGCKKLKGRLGYRIRQGDYRIIYDIQDHVLTVYIVAIGNRKDIYE